MIYWDIFVAFFISGMLGFGGGPASIPLIENEVVDRYGWLTTQQFSEIIALGNALPGPINTKLAGYIGYIEGGWFGAFVGIFATVAPSLMLMIALLSVVLKYKENPKVKFISSIVRPTIAVLLGVMTYQFFADAWEGIGSLQTIGIGVVSFLLLEKLKVHPVYVILGALLYGGIFLS